MLVWLTTPLDFGMPNQDRQALFLLGRRAPYSSLKWTVRIALLAGSGQPVGPACSAVNPAHRDAYGYLLGRTSKFGFAN